MLSVECCLGSQDIQKAALLGSREPKSALLCPRVSPSTGSHDVNSVLGIPTNCTQISPGEAQQFMGDLQTFSGCRLQEDKAVGVQDGAGEIVGSSFWEMGLFRVLGLRHVPRFCTECSECSQPGDTERWRAEETTVLPLGTSPLSCSQSRQKGH